MGAVRFISLLGVMVSVGYIATKADWPTLGAVIVFGLASLAYGLASGRRP